MNVDLDKILYVEEYFGYDDPHNVDSGEAIIYVLKDGEARRIQVSFKEENTLRSIFKRQELRPIIISEKRWLDWNSEKKNYTVFASQKYPLEPNLASRCFEVSINGKKLQIEPGDGIFDEFMYKIFYKPTVRFSSCHNFLAYLGGVVFGVLDFQPPTPEDWGEAILAQRANSGFDDNLESPVDKCSLDEYRVRDVVAEADLGKIRILYEECLPIIPELYDMQFTFNLDVSNSMMKLFEDFTQKLVGRINVEMQDNISERYKYFKVIDSDESDNLGDLFKNPVVINFSKRADDEIQNKILRDELSEEPTEFYLRNYFFISDRKIYTNMPKIACHVLENTKNSSLSYVARLILDEFTRL